MSVPKLRARLDTLSEATNYNVERLDERIEELDAKIDIVRESAIVIGEAVDFALTQLPRQQPRPPAKDTVAIEGKVFTPGNEMTLPSSISAALAYSERTGHRVVVLYKGVGDTVARERKVTVHTLTAKHAIVFAADVVSHRTFRLDRIQSVKLDG